MEIKNLFEGMTVCGPGVYSNITDANLRLAAYLSLDVELLAIRKNLSQQIALKSVRGILSPTKNEKAMEIHYVNALLNLESKDLAMPKIDDHYTSKCHPFKFNKLLISFLENLKEKFNAAGIINYIISSLSLEKLSNSTYGVMTEFEDNLNRYGSDNDFKMSDLFDQEAMDKNEYILDAQAEYYLFMTIAERLAQKKYLDIESYKKEYTVADKRIVILPEHSLKFSYIFDTTENVKKPIIPHCVTAILTGQEQTDPIMQFAASENLFTEQHKIELIQGMLSYMGSSQFLNLEEKKRHQYQENFLNSGYLNVNVVNEHFIEILKNMPNKWQAIFLEKNKIDSEQLKAFIANYFEQFMTVFSSLPAAHQRDYLSKHGEKIVMLIKNKGDLISLLHVLPEDDQCFVIERAKVERLIVDGGDLDHIFTILPEKSKEFFLKNLNEDFLRGINHSVLHVITILDNLSDDNKKIFLDKVGIKRLELLIKSSEDFYKFLNKVPESYQAEFCKNIKAKVLQKIFKTSYDFIIVFDTIESEKCKEILVDKLYEAKLIQPILNNREDYQNIFSKLPKSKEVFLLKNLDEELKRCFDRKNDNFSRFDLISALDSKITFALTIYDSKKISAFFHKMNDNEKSILRENVDLANKVLKSVGVKEIKLFLKQIGTDQFKKMITTEDKLYQLLDGLSSEKQTFILKIMNDKKIKSLLLNDKSVENAMDLAKSKISDAHVLKHLESVLKRKSFHAVIVSSLSRFAKKTPFISFFFNKKAPMKLPKEEDTDKDSKRPISSFH